MPDMITVKATGAQFTPHPEGTFAARCVDVIDLGMKVEAFKDQPKKLTHKLVLVFQTGEANAEAGTLHEVSAEFTASMNEKASLRKFLEQWRGKSYDEATVRKTGVPVDKLCGAPALITVEHKESQSGRLYAKVRSISPLPKQMTAPDLPAYDRPEFWEKRKQQYAADTAAFLGATAAQSHDDDFPAALQEEDDDLPF